jgi:hypothetical protein
MAASHRGVVPLLLVILLFALAPGCGSQPGQDDSTWRQEVNGSLQSFEDLRSLRYGMHLETWIGVSGQSIYGDEKGEGSYVDGDFSVAIARTSPAGEESLVFSAQADEYYLYEEDTWRAISSLEVPSPLYDPGQLFKLLSSYDEVSLQGEDDLSGDVCRRYLLRLGNDQARATMSERAWSYFSSLNYELNCTLWVSDASMPPASLQLEIIGLDPQESLQRYRALISVDLFDFDSPDIQLNLPGE